MQSGDAHRRHWRIAEHILIAAFAIYLLYFLTGFQKRDDIASEGALKFFLVGTVSSAVLLYGF